MRPRSGRSLNYRLLLSVASSVEADLVVIRSSDPYRELNPMAWRAAAQPPAGR
jgi:hypothetical protein